MKKRERERETVIESSKINLRASITELGKVASAKTPSFSGALRPEFLTVGIMAWSRGNRRGGGRSSSNSRRHRSPAVGRGSRKA